MASITFAASEFAPVALGFFGLGTELDHVSSWCFAAFQNEFSSRNFRIQRRLFGGHVFGSRFRKMRYVKPPGLQLESEHRRSLQLSVRFAFGFSNFEKR